MKRIFCSLFIFLLIQPLFSEEFGRPRFNVKNLSGYERQVIPFDIDIPGTTEIDRLDIEIKVLKGDGVVLNSKLLYSVTYDAINETSESVTTNHIDFVPLSRGDLEMKAVVTDLNNPGISLESDRLVIKISPRPPLFREHKPFLHFHHLDESYFVGQEILLSYEMFFSEMVQEQDVFVPDFSDIHVVPIPKQEDKTVYFSQKATTIKTLADFVVIGESPGILSIPPQELLITYIDRFGVEQQESVVCDGQEIEILEFPVKNPFKEGKDIIVGENITVSLAGYPEKIEKREEFEFDIEIIGEADFSEINSLSPFADLPGSFRETLVESERQIKNGKLVSRLLFRYEGRMSLFFQLRNIRFVFPVFNTENEEWETIEIAAPEIKAYSISRMVLATLGWFFSLFIIIFLIKSPLLRGIVKKGNPNNSGGNTEAKNDSGRMSDHEGMARFYQKYNLTAREQEISELLYSGKSTKDMADALFISPETVKKHIKNIMKKTDTHSRYEFFTLAASISEME